MQHKTKWHSLSDFRDFLIKEGNEKIVSFNGYQLITDKNEYSLAFSNLNIKPIEQARPKAIKKISANKK